MDLQILRDRAIALQFFPPVYRTANRWNLFFLSYRVAPVSSHERFIHIQPLAILLNLNDIGKSVEKEWLITKQIRKNVDLDSYIVMPNHFHAIIIIESRISIPIPTRTNNNQSINPNETPCRETLIANSLGSIMGQFKSKCTKRIHTAGIPNFYWQARYYDRIIRNESELINIRNYIKENPARWNLKNTLPENYKP